ncbi:GyrI-like domain-containing protein [Lederbergia graminis]|uniref:GyrI-like domain-containing protein n=1 Tax=Lederbergia graminis TaxID=735518 RepID=A0ABW0LEB7_9BACI
MKYHLQERGSFNIVGIKELINCNDEFDQSKEIDRFWTQISQDGMIDRLLSLNSGQISGLIGATVNYIHEKNQIEYWVAVDSNEQSPEGLNSFEVPASKWAIFEVVGPVADVVPATWKKIYSEWFPSSDYEHSGAPSLEVYKSADPTSLMAKTEIWIPIK